MVIREQELIEREERRQAELMEKFNIDRINALRSLRRDKLEFVARKYNFVLPKEEEIFWSLIHKARHNDSKNFNKEERKVSEKWLLEHGFNTDPWGYDTSDPKLKEHFGLE